MEYFAYGDLGNHISAGMTENDVKVVTRQLLDGLAIMHKERFTHRDLKPQNIFVVSISPEWWVKIGDFGIAKRVGNKETALRTQTGTPLFQAPEIMDYLEDDSESSEYSNAVNIWSLGCVTYNMLAGKVPFSGRSAIHKFARGALPFPTDELAEKSASTEVIDFLKTVIVSAPIDRLTAETALESSWVQSAEEAPSGLAELSINHTKQNPSEEEPASVAGHAADNGKDLNATARPLPRFKSG